MPVSSRKPGPIREFRPATTSSWLSSRSGLNPWAIVSRGEWSVSTAHWWPRARAASAMSSIGLPPSDQSECR